MVCKGGVKGVVRVGDEFVDIVNESKKVLLRFGFIGDWFLENRRDGYYLGLVAYDGNVQFYRRLSDRVIGFDFAVYGGVVDVFLKSDWVVFYDDGCLMGFKENTLVGEGWFSEDVFILDKMVVFVELHKDDLYLMEECDGVCVCEDGVYFSMGYGFLRKKLNGKNDQGLCVCVNSRDLRRVIKYLTTDYYWIGLHDDSVVVFEDHDRVFVYLGGEKRVVSKRKSLYRFEVNDAFMSAVNMIGDSDSVYLFMDYALGVGALYSVDKGFFPFPLKSEVELSGSYLYDVSGVWDLFLELEKIGVDDQLFGVDWFGKLYFNGVWLKGRIVDKSFFEERLRVYKKAVGAEKICVYKCFDKAFELLKKHGLYSYFKRYRRACWFKGIRIYGMDNSYVLEWHVKGLHGFLFLRDEVKK